MPFTLKNDALTHLLTLITCNGRLELGNAWRDLQSLHKNSLLTLNTDVLGPSDEAGEIALGLDVSTDSEVMGVLLEEGFLGLGFAAVLFDEHGPFGGCLLYLLVERKTVSKGYLCALTI